MIEMNQAETLEFVVRDGIRFLSSLTRHYGAEEGMRMWDEFGKIFGPEVKGKVFFAMLTGEMSDRVTFRAGKASSLGYAVPVIKAIRTHSGLGLKEAKDLWDASQNGQANVQCSNPDAARSLIRELLSLGCLA